MSKHKHSHDDDAPEQDPVPEVQPGAAAPDEPAVAPQAPADELTALGQERDDLMARLQRVSADYVNYQKRAQKDLAQSREYANEALIKALLVVLDDMERALKAAREHAEGDNPLLTGMQLVHDKALQVLGTFGLSPIEAEGQPFNPEYHQAVSMHPTDKLPPQTVLAQLQKGYLLKGRMLRPASVVVAVAPE